MILLTLIAIGITVLVIHIKVIAPKNREIYDLEKQILLEQRKYANLYWKVMDSVSDNVKFSKQTDDPNIQLVYLDTALYLSKMINLADNQVADLTKLYKDEKQKELLKASKSKNK